MPTPQVADQAGAMGWLLRPAPALDRLDCCGIGSEILPIGSREWRRQVLRNRGGAVTTFLAVFVALFKDSIREWRRKPKLIAACEDSPPRPIGAPYFVNHRTVLLFHDSFPGRIHPVPSCAGSPLPSHPVCLDLFQVFVFCLWNQK